MKPTLFESIATSTGSSAPKGATARILGRFPGVRSPRPKASPEGERGLVPAIGCLFGEGQWTLVLAGATPRCISQFSTPAGGARKEGESLPDLVRRRLLVLGVGGRPREVVIGADLDPLAVDERLSQEVLEAAQILVAAGIRIRLSTRGAPHPDSPFGRLLARAAAGAGAALEVRLVAMDAEITRAYEPGAPPPSERLVAARRLGAMGVVVEGRLGPMLPWIADTTAHLEASVEAFRGAGIRLVRASYFQLDIEGTRRIRKLRPAHRALLRGCFRGEPRHASEAHLLPRDLRKKGYSRLTRIAARAGIEIVVCEETNPDVSIAKACFSKCAPEPRRRERSGARSAKSVEPRPSRTLMAGLFDAARSETGAAARVKAWKKPASPRAEAQLDLFGQR